MPGMQNPHCTPPSSTNASPSTRRVSSASPSTVTTSRPSICSGFRRQDNAGYPSIRTRQQPQVPSGAQPSFAETTPHSSRSTSRKCIPRSYAASVARPFKLNLTRGILCNHSKADASHSRRGVAPATRISALGGHMDQPWKTDKWYVSPWCFLPDVRKSYTFAPNIKIHDVTLRDGEQQTAVVFRREEKVAIARKLDALGVHRIEAGMPAVSEQDKAAIQDIAALGLKSEIFGFARCIPDEI